MYLILLNIFWVLFLLFIWFNTTAFVDYCRLLNITKITKIDDFLQYKKINPKISYLSFIRKKDTFFIRLITCIPCLCFWFSLLVVSLGGVLSSFPIVYITSYFTYLFLRKKFISYESDTDK